MGNEERNETDNYEITLELMICSYSGMYGFGNQLYS